jgi:hypothetical protein
MEPKEFVLWLKGYTDGIGIKGPTPAQWSRIQHELALCFNKVTPYRPNMPSDPKKKDENRKPVDIRVRRLNEPLIC